MHSFDFEFDIRLEITCERGRPERRVAAASVLAA